MVIRKPYAFLIRHFRLIHFLIILPMFITLLCTRTLLSFFSSFVASGYMTSETNIASLYINPIVYLCLILIIVSIIVIILLLKSKDKDIKAHLIISIFYFVLLILFMLAPGILTRFETTDVAGTTARMYRDIVNFIYYVQYALIILMFIKGLGFDFQRFQFIDLLSELDLDEEDSDEVEFRIGVEGYKAKRTIRKTLREFKYYLMENKFFVSIILGVLLVIAVIMLIINIVNGNRTVRVKQVFSLNGFSIKFNNSLVSNLDYNGHIISEGKYYLAVNLYVKNNSSETKALDTDDFRLEIGKDKFKYPIPSMSGRFLDFGRPYYGERVQRYKEYEYLLVYELTEKELRNSYTIKVLDSITYTDDDTIAKYKVITLRPMNINKISYSKEVDLGSEVDFKGTNLGNTKLKIDSFTVTNKYLYEYDFCLTEDDCIRSKNSITPTVSSKGENTLIALNGAFEIDQDTSYSKYKLTNNNFYSDFMEIEYTVGGNTHTSKVVNKTPEEVVGTKIIEVPKRVENAEHINLVITVRNTRYIYKLK